MQISLRSHLIAGTAAVVGAGAIAMTPVVAQHEALPNIQLPSASAAVALAGFDSPITELIGTIGLAGNYLFSPDAGPSPMLPPTVGLLPQFITGALPIIRQLGLDGSDYITTTAGALLTAAGITSEVTWNLPGNLIDAGKLAIGGDVDLAIALLQATVLDPLIAAGKTAINGLAYPVQYALKRAIAVGEFLVNDIGSIAQIVAGQAKVVVDSFTRVINNTINAGSAEGAWNALVDGFFGAGPGSVPSVLLNVTVGFGQNVDPLDPLSDFVPSTRTVVWGAGQAIKGILASTTPPPPPITAAKKSVAASVAAKRSAAPSVAAVSSSADNNGGASVGGGDNGGSKSAGKSSSNSGNSDRGSSKASKH